MPPDTGQAPLSVAIICKDAARTLRPVLASVKGLAAEIVAVDSGSTDGTIGILHAHRAVVHREPWRGYAHAKRVACSLSRQPWVLQLDADEPVTAELAASIRRMIETDDGTITAARLNRVVWYRGEPLRHAWQPEHVTRLVRRDALSTGCAAWEGAEPHPALVVKSGRVVTLEGALRHDSFETFSEHLARQLKHARDAAGALHAAGKKPSLLRLATSPIGAFFKQIVLKRAHADGPAGWLAAGTAAAGTLMKHMLLLERHLMAGEGPSYHEPSRGAAARETTAATGASARSAPGVPTQSVSRRETSRPMAAADEPARDPSPEAESAEATETEAPSSEAPSSEASGSEAPETELSQPAGEDGETSKKKKRRRRRRKKKTATAEVEPKPAAIDDDEDLDDDEDDRQSEKLRAVVPMSEEAKKHVFDTETSFKDLGLKDEILRALDDHGWEHPTKIQGTLVPVAVTGKDVLGQAKTGSGKTAAFGLPLLQLAENGQPFQALILAPTRELAIQIKDDLTELAKYTGLKVVPVYGGQKIQTQADRLRKGPEIIVGTPGRIMDMNNRGLLPLDKIRFAVLDEVDRMFDIGFRDDIKRILGLCPKQRQTVFVSATISDEIERLVKKHMIDPERLTVASGSLTVELVKQHHIPVNGWDKKRMLAHVLTHEEPDLTIVFCRMKRTVDKLADFLADKGIPALALHGDLSQGKRNQTMKKFRAGTLGVLVASDLAARGLDVDGISHVVNYDLPDDPDLYVHRIGRTARAGREGIAWSLVTPEQGKLLTEIENLINAEIPKKDYPDFEPRETPPDGWKPEPTGGRPPVVVEGVDKPTRSRYEDLGAPDTEKLSKEELAAKFPGGVVPKKPPKRRIRGTVRTHRGNRDA
ncbi:MAG: DEAD/DEAH box helicase [Planctomycetota bacterium]